ncbi:MAG: LPS export ABC transporter periplasmic protein LptC [Bacillota bacterium]
MQKRWLIIISIILVVISSLFYFGVIDESSNPSHPTPDEDKTTKQPPQKEVSQAVVEVSSEDGQTDLELTADKLIQPADESYFKLDEVTIKVFTVNQKQERESLQATLTAPQGIYWPQEGKLKFFTGVVVKNERLRVKADELFWNQTKNRWRGIGNIKLTHHAQQVEVTGERFIAPVELKELRVLGDTRLIHQ